MEYGDFNLDEEQTKELNKNLDELSEKIDKYEREYDDRKVITDDLLTGLNTIEENLKNLINKADQIKLDVPVKREEGIIKELTAKTNIFNIYPKERIKVMRLLTGGKRFVLGTAYENVCLYEINGKDIILKKTLELSKDRSVMHEITCINEIITKDTTKDETQIAITTMSMIYIYKVTNTLVYKDTLTNFHKDTLLYIINLDENKFITASEDNTIIIQTPQDTEESVKKKTISGNMRPISLLKLKDNLFCVGRKGTGDKSKIEFYNSSSQQQIWNFYDSKTRKDKNTLLDKGCVTSNGLFFIPKSNKRTIKNDYVVFGYDNEKDGPEAKAEIIFLNLNVDKLDDNKEAYYDRIIMNNPIRCKNEVSFMLFKEKYLLQTCSDSLIQIDIDKKSIVKTITKKEEGFSGLFLGILPEKGYLITDNEKQNNEQDRKGNSRKINRYGVTIFEITYE